MGISKLRLRMKDKKAAAHKRKRQPREPYEVVLIVCEGEKTEPHYLESLRRHLRLSNTNIRICGKECGSAPISVVNYALEEYRNNQGIYDRIYCVFDKDKHISYEKAKVKISTTKLSNGATIHAITSTPCFEIWVLLHFEYTTRSFSAAGTDSNCALVVKQLKRYIKDYEKGNPRVFEIVCEKINDAIERATRLELFHQTSGSDNPSTRMHELVEYLMVLKDK